MQLDRSGSILAFTVAIKIVQQKGKFCQRKVKNKNINLVAGQYL